MRRSIYFPAVFLCIARLSALRAPISPQMAAAPALEFSRPLNVASLGRKATRTALSATADECAALCTRFGLDGLGALDANVSCAIVDPRRTRVRAYGTLKARDVQQKLSTTLGEATTLQVESAAFETFFVDEGAAMNVGKFADDDDDSYDEPIEGGQIDIGELVAQHLYLYLGDLEMRRYAEYTEDSVGTVVFDTDPDD